MGWVGQPGCDEAGGMADQVANTAMNDPAHPLKYRARTHRQRKTGVPLRRDQA